VAALNFFTYRCLSLILVAGLLSSCGKAEDAASDIRNERPDSVFGEGGAGALANGERIFRSATSHSRPIVSSTGAKRPDGTPLLSCADCHGAGGAGGVITSGGRKYVSPPIHIEALTRDRMQAGVPPYSEVTLGLALRTGVTPEGRKLDTLMPRWRMTAQDQADLYRYLESLSPPLGGTGAP
jgi:hypothetical protein